MNTSPLQRAVAVTGLALIAPVAFLLAADRITLATAAYRASIVLILTFVLQSVVRSALLFLASSVETPPGAPVSDQRTGSERAAASANSASTASGQSAASNSQPLGTTPAGRSGSFEVAEA